MSLFRRKRKNTVQNARTEQKTQESKEARLLGKFVNGKILEDGYEGFWASEHDSLECLRHDMPAFEFCVMEVANYLKYINKMTDDANAYFQAAKRKLIESAICQDGSEKLQKQMFAFEILCLSNSTVSKAKKYIHSVSYLLASGGLNLMKMEKRLSVGERSLTASEIVSIVIAQPDEFSELKAERYAEKLVASGFSSENAEFFLKPPEQELVREAAMNMYRISRTGKDQTLPEAIKAEETRLDRAISRRLSVKEDERARMADILRSRLFGGMSEEQKEMFRENCRRLEEEDGITIDLGI